MSSELADIESDTFYAIRQDPLSQSSAEHMEEKSSSPASSPPLEVVDVHSPKRKRSDEDVNVESDTRDVSSGTLSGNTDQPGDETQNQQMEKDSVPSSATLPSASAPSMGPPPVPGTLRSSMLPPSQKPPQSGQGSYTSRQAPFQPPTSREPATSPNVQNGALSADLRDSDIDGATPAEKIEDFEWNDLEIRYHDEMKRLNDVEEDIMAEFNNLCRYFSIWAYAGTSKEVDRSYKRLKTQMTLVQYHEDELEKKRLHYVKVVEAFQSALQLLGT